MKYGSVCSGIEAATQAWHPLGWEPAWFSEIEKFPSAVLAHHHPNVPNLGDMTSIRGGKHGVKESIDLLVGGTPCQSFSIAGLRGGLDDERGNLSLEFVRLADALQPRWLVWENVPGVLSSNQGRDFGSFLGALAEIGYGFSYRVLDAQYFGLAQRRKRVCVVGCLGDWRRAATVLLESKGMCGDTPPSREAREETTPSVAGCLGSRGIRSHTELDGHGAYVPEVGNCLTNRMHKGFNTTLDEGHTPVVAHVLKVRGGSNTWVDARDGKTKGAGKGALIGKDQSFTLGVSQDQTLFDKKMAVRRLTPTECERLQGFPDGYTQIPWRNKEASECPDGPRYKSLGNSMAVPVMRWVGQRIKLLEDSE